MPTPSFVVDRLWPDPAFDLDLDAVFADRTLPTAPVGRPFVGVNMVTSIDGRAQVGGTAEGLGSRADRRLMRLLRVPYDAVGSGAGTLRASGLWLGLPPGLAERRAARGLPPQAQVLIAGRSPVPLEARWFSDDARRLLFVGADNPMSQPPATELLRAPTAVPEPHWVLEQLLGRGIGSLLLEGGPTTNAAFLAADAIDELCWTIGPRLLANDALPMIGATVAPPREGRLVSIYRHGDELFLRYRFTSR